MKYSVLPMVGFALLLSACEFSLAGDLTPPPVALISGQGTPEPIAMPAADPDLQSGAAIYVQNCAPCHGASGLGDGEQAASLPFAPAPIGDPDLARAASPAEWYRWVSEGRFTRYMPPFASVLTPQERWDVLAFAYSLSLDEIELQSGAELHSKYQGEIGQLLAGDELAAEVDVVARVGLGEDDTRALTAYLQARVLGIESSLDLDLEAIEPPAEGLADLPTYGVLSGQVLSGSGDSLPAGLEVTLSGYDHTEQVLSETVTLLSNGSFSFKDIPISPERIFFAQVPYEGQIYFSEFINATGEQTEFKLPITIYETTTQTDQLAVESVQLFFDFSKPGVVRVAQQVAISNLGDHVVVPQEAGEPVLHYSLPPEAGNLAFKDGELGERYITEEGGFGDLRGVLPGESSYQLLFAYELPYANGVSFRMHIELPTRALTAYLPAGEIEVQSEAFQFIGDQSVAGTIYSAYSAEAGYFPGDEVLVALGGAHPLGTYGLSSLLQDDSLLLGLAAVTTAVGLAWLWVRRLPAQGPQQLMDEIIALDEKYEQGRVAQSAYTKRRVALKAQLRSALNTRSQA